MKAFSLIETIIIISIIAILSYLTLPKTNSNDLELISSKIVLYLKQTRYQALIDNQYDPTNMKWQKKRWSMKFFRCNKKVGGLYYLIYSDKNTTGQIKKEHTLKDPLTKKYLYSFHTCTQTKDSSKYVLLTKNFDIVDVSLSCNSTDSLGQISFGSDGRVYSRLENTIEKTNKYEIKNPCTLKITHKNGDYKEIIIEPLTGYIYINR